MKKTGKALSLVLSLALVVSSLTATFASAAATKSEYLGASDSNVTVDLVNGKSGGDSKTDVTSKIPYSVDGTTYDHLTVAGMTAQDVVMSGGQDLVTPEVVANNSKIYLSLKDASLSGSETLAVRYTATKHRYTAPSTDILFSVVKFYTVKVHKLNGYEISLSDGSLDKYGTISGTKMSEDLDITVNQYQLKTGQSATDRWSTSAAQKVTNIQKNDGSFDTSKVQSGDVGEFFVKVSSSNGVSYTTPGKKVTATLTAPTGADFLNQGGLVAYAVKTVTDSNTKSVILDNTNTLTATATVTNTVTLPSNYGSITTWHGSTWAIPDNSAAFDEKSSGSQDPLNQNSTVPVANAINVTNANVVLGETTTMSNTAIVGDVTGAHNFTINGGYAKSVTLTGATFAMTKGTTGAVSAATVNVTGGTAGAISATTVKLDASDAKVPTVVGAITAKDIEIKSANAAVTTGAIKMTGSANPVDSGAANGGKLDLMADKLSVPSVDFDHYNATLNFDGFTGTVAAPANAENGQIIVSTNVSNSVKSNATITGAVNVKNIQLTEGALNIATAINVDTISGAGTLTIPAGKMFVNGSITGVSLKLSDAKLTPGMTAFSATAYKVYDGMFTPVGFTIDYDAVNAVTNRTTDVFKIKTVVFAGLSIAPVSGTSNKILKGTSASFKATTYPSGTAIPAGTAIKVDFSGSSDNFKAEVSGDTIKVTALKYDELFSSLNKGTITASLVDATTGLSAYNYSSATATYDVTMIAKPETKYTSDTNSTLNLKVGQQYTYKITSSDGSDPKLGFGTKGIAKIAKTSKTTSGTTVYYYYTVEGVKEGGTGVFVADGAKINVVNVKGSAFTSDTKVVTVKSGKTYTFKITAVSKYTAPVVFQVCGFSAKNTKAGKVTTNKDGTVSYLYTITNNGTANGVYGAYVNGVRVALVTAAK